MSNSVISEGKTTNEAVENGLKILQVSKNDVEIKVLENEDKRSFFDILAPRVVKVELTVKEGIKNEKKEEKQQIPERKENTEKKHETIVSKEDLEKAKQNVETFLKTFLSTISEKHFDYSIKIENDEILIDINGEDSGMLIGYRGDSMNSLQNILSAVANKNCESRIKIILDIEGYKEKRVKVLEELAVKVSKTVVRNGKSITLEPMTAYERKIIHSKLQENPEITTYSVGEDPYRKIVIAKR